MSKIILWFGLLFVVLLHVHCSPSGDKKQSDEPHTNPDGEHNVKYDHEAFLGEKEAAEFDNLPLEESKRRLRYDSYNS